MSLKDFLESDSDITVLISEDSLSASITALDLYDQLERSTGLRGLFLTRSFSELSLWGGKLSESLEGAAFSHVNQALTAPDDNRVRFITYTNFLSIYATDANRVYISNLEDYTTEDFLMVLSRCKPEGKLKATLTQREADQFEFYRLWKDSGIKSNKVFLKVTEQGVIVSEEGDVSISFITL